MEILRDYRQIVDKVKNVFNIDVTNLPILDTMPGLELKELVTVTPKNVDLSQVVGLAELIFQLNEYIPALCNFVKMFLYSKNYQAVIAFMEKLFVAHVGIANYVSKNKEYSHKERFFDRFVEVIKSTDISPADFLPFLFAIVEDDDRTRLSAWLAPTLEFLQNFYRENIIEVRAFIDANPMHKNTYYTLGLEFNTQNAICEIFNEEDETLSEKMLAKMLKHYYTDTMAFFDKNLENSGNKKFHYVRILASIEKPEVTARLENLYEEEADPEIKNFVKTKLGIADKINLGVSPKHFETMAYKKVAVAQERTLGIPFEKVVLRFNDGTQTNNIIKTHFINVFKEEKELLNLYGLGEIKDLFIPEDLFAFAKSMFETIKRFNDIKEAKWAIRLVALLCDNKLEEEVFEFVYELFAANRAKEARYFLEALIYAKNHRVINLLQKLIESGMASFISVKDYFVELYAENVAKDVSDVQNVLATDEVSDSAIETQKQRLFANFIANKSYTKEQFEEIFINKKVFNILAQKLVFGEYKQNRIVSLFVVEDSNIKYIAGNAQADDKDICIKIAHTLDIDERYEEVKNYFQEPTFRQFTKTCFAIKDSDKTSTKVANMQGVLINALKFVSNMIKFGFTKNITNETEDIKELVYVSTELNLLAEVSFETPANNLTSTASLGAIRFYKLNQCLKNGSAFIINKANAVALGGVEPRLYDYVVGAVASSIRN